MILHLIQLLLVVISSLFFLRVVTSSSIPHIHTTHTHTHTHHRSNKKVTLNTNAKQSKKTFCTSNRHVHLSSGRDASTSIIISFSSHPCDTLQFKEQQQQQQQQEQQQHDQQHDQQQDGTMAWDEESKYESYKDLTLNRSGVMLSTNRDHLLHNHHRHHHHYKEEKVNNKNEHPDDDYRIIFINQNDEKTGISHRYNTTIIHKKQRIQYWSEYQHHVIITGVLRPDTTYYYKCIVDIHHEPTVLTEEEKDDDDYYNYDDDDADAADVDAEDNEEDEYDNDYYNDENGGDHNNIYEDYDRRRKRRIQHTNHSAKNTMVHKDVVDLNDAAVTTANDDDDYEYEYDDDDDDVIFSFKTAPLNDKDSTTKFAIMGDLGVFSHTKESLRNLAKNIDDIDFVILAGDISYANGDHRIWDDFFDMMDDMSFLTKKPLYTAAGNHDVESNKETGEMFTSYETRFLMPQIARAEIGKVTSKSDYDLNQMYQLKYDYGNSYYSFTYGPSHNIVLNAFADFEPDSIQYQWLVQELNNVNRELSPWVTVTVHCPMYSTFKQHHNDPQLVNLKKFLEPLFVMYKVNFVLSGHLHAYMRTKPVAFGEVTEDGPIHIVLGNGGRQANAPYLNPEPEEWVAVRDHTTYGWGSIEYLNMTTARYEWIQSGHNQRGDRGNNFFDAPKNLSDVAFIRNQFFT